MSTLKRSQFINLAREGEIDFLYAINAALYQEGSLENAIDIAHEAIETEENPRLMQRLGELYMMAGERFLARSIFCNAHVHDSEAPSNVSNVVNSKIPVVRAVVDDSVGLFYVPMPKCGSSTIKNYIIHAKYGEHYGGAVHYHHKDLYRTVPISDIETRYKDYNFITVIRDPIDRLASYFKKNICLGSLRRECRSNTEHMSLATKPTVGEIANNFFLYRQSFLDFRQHTDRASDYIGASSLLCENTVNLKEIADVRKRISGIYGSEIPDKKAMVGDSKKEDLEVVKKTLSRKAILDWYSDDIAMVEKLNTDRAAPESSSKASAA